MTARRHFLELIAASAALGFHSRVGGDAANAVCGNDIIAA